MTNDEVMTRYGYRLCERCHTDEPADTFVGGLCKLCANEEEA